MRNARRRKSESNATTESLEQRALLTAVLNGNTLEITGTEGPDDIVVTKAAGQFMVVENGGPVQSFPRKVTTIKINTFGGNDTVDTTDIGITTTSRINVGSGADIVAAGRGPNNIRGGAGDDIIRGSRLGDTISGGGGDDWISGGRRDDLLIGGSGDDTIFGGGDDDTVFGGNGSDSLLGGGGDDTVFGESGNDILAGNAGSDSLRGGNGGDAVDGGNGNDTVRGGTGADTMTGGSGDDLMLGSGGHDMLDGGDDRDVMVGGENSDTLMGGAGEDILIAGTKSLGAAELSLVAAEWRSVNTYDQRVANIRNGAGRNNGRANGDEYLVGRERNHLTTVFNDVGHIDHLMGEAGQDWFFLAVGFGDDDVTSDRVAGERREEI